MTSLSFTTTTALLLHLIAVPGSNAASQDPKPPLPKAVPLQIDYSKPPLTWLDALDGAEMAVVIKVTGLNEEQRERLPVTRVQAEIIEVIKAPAGVAKGGVISVIRYGGTVKAQGTPRMQEERHFPPWRVGQTFLVFLARTTAEDAYSMPFGPAATFELDQATKKVRALVATKFAASQNGRTTASVLDALKAAYDRSALSWVR